MPKAAIDACGVTSSADADAAAAIAHGGDGCGRIGVPCTQVTAGHSRACCSGRCMAFHRGQWDTPGNTSGFCDEENPGNRCARAFKSHAESAHDTLLSLLPVRQIAILKVLMLWLALRATGGHAGPRVCGTK